MKNPPIMFPAKAPRHRKRHSGESAPPPPPPATVHVYSVVRQTDHLIIWTFTADATPPADGSGVPQLLVQTTSGLEGPAETWQESANQIGANYDDGQVLEGTPYQVNEQPVGIAFAGGQTLILPQSGLVD